MSCDILSLILRFRARLGSPIEEEEAREESGTRAQSQVSGFHHKGLSLLSYSSCLQLYMGKPRPGRGKDFPMVTRAGLNPRLLPPPNPVEGRGWDLRDGDLRAELKGPLEKAGMSGQKGS